MSLSPTEIRPWYIYKLTNPSGNIYIGKTYNLKGRMSNYKYIAGRVTSQRILANSLRKYGFENHKLDIIEQFNSNQDDANSKEMFWIRSHMSNINKWRDGVGMNLTNGGEGAIGNIWTDESRAKLSKANVGKIISESQRQKSSAYNKANPPQYWKGRKMSDESRLKMSIAKKGKPSYRRVFPMSIEQKAKISFTKSKPVLKFDLQNNFIKEYPNSLAAAKEHSVARGTIFNNIEGKGSVKLKFKFKYK